MYSPLYKGALAFSCLLTNLINKKRNVSLLPPATDALLMPLTPLPVDGSIDTSDCYLWIGVPTTSRPVISFSLLPPGTCIHFNGTREGDAS